MNEFSLFFIIFVGVLGSALMIFKLKVDRQYHKDIPYMPKKYTNIITLACSIQIIGSIINLIFTPFPYSTAIIFILLGGCLTTIFVMNRKRTKIIEAYWKETIAANEQEEKQ